MHADQPDPSEKSIFFMPAQGNIFIRYQNRIIWVRRTKETIQATGVAQESIVLSTLGRSTSVLKDIIEEGYQLSKNLDQNQTVIYSWYNQNWERTLAKPHRPWNSVKLNNNLASELLSDVERFLANKEIYQQRGIPHRRGFLLYGPPGTGKTSFITALAGKLHYSIATLSLSNSTLTDDGLVHALSTMPPETILLLEDIDAIFNEDRLVPELVVSEPISNEQPARGPARRGQNTREMKSETLSFSGLLNALDGVSTADGRLLFMTTNHKEKLDPALIRPGRVDREVLIDEASNSTIAAMFEHFYSIGSSDPKDIKRLSKKLATHLESITHCHIPMANIQNHFLMHMNHPERAILPEQLAILFSNPQSQ